MNFVLRETVMNEFSYLERRSQAILKDSEGLSKLHVYHGDPSFFAVELFFSV